MEGLLLLKLLLQKENCMCKVNLSNGYFSVPLHQESQERLKFKLKDSLYQLFCLSFGLGPAPRVYTKLMKKSHPPVVKIERMSGNISE